MSDSHDSDGDFVLGKKSKKKSGMIYSDPEVWESDQESDDTPLKNKSRKSKKVIESESESDSNTESDAMSDDDTESDENSSSSSEEGTLCFLLSVLFSMVVRVVEFSSRGYKIRRFLRKN